MGATVLKVMVTALIAASSQLLAGIGDRSLPAPLPAPPVPTAGADLSACAEPVTAVVGTIGRRVYRNDEAGLNSVFSRHRIGGSKKLGDAIARGDRVAALSALRALLFQQVTRVAVYRGATEQPGERPFVAIGHQPALAPVHAKIRDSSGAVVAHFAFSIQGDEGFTNLTAKGPGTQVVLREGTRLVGGSLRPAPAAIPDRGALDFNGTTYQAYSFIGTAFDGHPLRISYLVPPQGIAAYCANTREETILNTVGTVGVGVYTGELEGDSTNSTRTVIGSSPELVSAAAARSRARIKRAIRHLFDTRLHVVRVRVLAPDGSLLYDLGGADVLAPVEGDLRLPGGPLAGHFIFSLQDDPGYWKLVNHFTGADVLMRVGGREVSGTLDPGPPNPPDYGQVHYRGVDYWCFSFMATAFPDTPMRISILVRPEIYN